VATATSQAREALARRLLRLKRDLTAPELAPDTNLAAVLWQASASMTYMADLLRQPPAEAEAQAPERTSEGAEHRLDAQQPQQDEPEIVWWSPPGGWPDITTE